MDRPRQKEGTEMTKKKQSKKKTSKDKEIQRAEELVANIQKFLVELGYKSSDEETKK